MTEGANQPKYRSCELFVVIAVHLRRVAWNHWIERGPKHTGPSEKVDYSWVLGYPSYVRPSSSKSQSSAAGSDQSGSAAPAEKSILKQRIELKFLHYSEAFKFHHTLPKVELRRRRKYYELAKEHSSIAELSKDLSNCAG